MATIPSDKKFHAVADTVNTEDKGSALCKSLRESYTMQDIMDTVSAGGGVDGSGSTAYIPIWSDSNTLTDSIMKWNALGITVDGQMNISETLNTAPSSATDTGVPGEIRWTPDHVYFCMAVDTWVRAALVTW